MVPVVAPSIDEVPAEPLTVEESVFEDPVLPLPDIWVCVGVSDCDIFVCELSVVTLPAAEDPAAEVPADKVPDEVPSVEELVKDPATEVSVVEDLVLEVPVDELPVVEPPVVVPTVELPVVAPSAVEDTPVEDPVEVPWTELVSVGELACDCPVRELGSSEVELPTVDAPPCSILPAALPVIECPVVEWLVVEEPVIEDPDAKLTVSELPVELATVADPVLGASVLEPPDAEAESLAVRVPDVAGISVPEDAPIWFRWGGLNRGTPPSLDSLLAFVALDLSVDSVLLSEIDAVVVGAVAVDDVSLDGVTFGSMVFGED